MGANDSYGCADRFAGYSISKYRKKTENCYFRNVYHSEDAWRIAQIGTCSTGAKVPPGYVVANSVVGLGRYHLIQKIEYTACHV